MADKLSWTELRRAIANRADASENTVNAFLNALQSELTEGLKSDRQVKINGLGSAPQKRERLYWRRNDYRRLQQNNVHARIRCQRAG